MGFLDRQPTLDIVAGQVAHGENVDVESSQIERHFTITVYLHTCVAKGLPQRGLRFDAVSVGLKY